MPPFWYFFTYMKKFLWIQWNKLHDQKIFVMYDCKNSVLRTNVLFLQSTTAALSDEISNLSYKMPIKKRKKGRRKGTFWWKWNVDIVLDASCRSATICLNSCLKCWFCNAGNLGILMVYFILFPIVLFWDISHHICKNQQQCVTIILVFFFPKNFKVFLQTSSM